MPGMQLSGHRLRAERERQGLSQAELARKATPPLTAETVRRLEKDRHTPNLRTINRLAVALGVPTDALLAPTTEGAAPCSGSSSPQPA